MLFWRESFPLVLNINQRPRGCSQIASVAFQHQRSLLSASCHWKLSCTLKRLFFLLQVLCDFRSLQILYLQGNQIKDLHQVDKLSGMPKLRKLNLHGNPVDREKVLWFCFSSPQIYFLLFLTKKCKLVSWVKQKLSTVQFSTFTGIQVVLFEDTSSTAILRLQFGHKRWQENCRMLQARIQVEEEGFSGWRFLEDWTSDNENIWEWKTNSISEKSWKAKTTATRLIHLLAESRAPWDQCYLCSFSLLPFITPHRTIQPNALE